MSINRDQIIKCACDLYLSEGTGGFTMRKLAKCVGCTAPALYRHYENKEEVMQEVLGEAFRVFVQYLYRALEGQTPEERFQIAGLSHLQFALENPALYEVIYAPLEMLGIHRGEGEAADHACAVGRFWTDRVREMMDAGFLIPGDPWTVALTLWGHSHGLISIYHRGLLGEVSEEEFRGVVLDSFLQIVRGVGTEKYQQVLQDRADVGDLEGVGVVKPLRPHSSSGFGAGR
jgi:AcrR family transcriptional regulator